MSRRRQIQRHLAALGDIDGIMGAMKNMALTESRKLGRFVDNQHRVLAGIEAAAADFLGHYPEFAARPAAAADVVVAVGSQRGFCGDFNEAVAQALRAHWRVPGNEAARAVVVGRRLAAKLEREPRVAAVLDGPSVTEEIEPVLQRLMSSLADLQTEARRGEALAVAVLAHREAEGGLLMHPILPAPPARTGAPRAAYPPLLNLAPARFFGELAHHYLWAQMHNSFYGSLACENRRRLQHLEGAMQRLEDKCAGLRRRCNALRQEEITEEIEVIMLSAMASRRDAERGSPR